MNPTNQIAICSNEFHKSSIACSTNGGSLAYLEIILWEHRWKSRQQQQNPALLQHTQKEVFQLPYRVTQVLSAIRENGLVKNLRQLDAREAALCHLKLHLFLSLSDGKHSFRNPKVIHFCTGSYAALLSMIFVFTYCSYTWRMPVLSFFSLREFRNIFYKFITNMKN